MRISSLLLLVLALAQGCSRGTRDEITSGASATFLSDPVTGEADETVSTAAFSDIPKERIINFTACLKDVAVQQSVVGVPFRVMNGASPLSMRTNISDQAGCVRWTETFAFEATRKETFYEIERTIEATSQHQGQITVRLGINPWLKGSASVRDLSVRGAPETSKLGQASSGPADDSVGLLIEAVDTNLDIRGGVAQLRLSFEPKLRRLDLSGAAVNQALTKGSFNVRAKVLAITPEGTLPFTSELSVPSAEFKASNVRVEGNVTLLRKIRRESTLELDFVAEPVDASGQLKAVHGRVPLGRLSGLSLSAKRELKVEKDAYVAAAPNLSPLLGGEAASPALQGFELGRVSVKEVVVKELDQSGRPKLLEVEYRAVVMNSATPDPILDQAFQIKEGEETQVKKSDEDDGVLRWKATYAFDFYAKQEPQKHEISVKASKFFGSAVVKRNVYLNLWEYEAPGSVAIDEEKDGAPSPSVVSAQAGGAELTLSSVMFNFVERTFTLDSQLNLTTTRKYRFELAPEIRRMSRNRGWLPPTNLGNGRFRVRFLLETIDKENPVVIDAQELELESRNGKITASVGFHLNDIRQAAVRSNLTIQVLPIEERSSLVSTASMGTIDMLGGFSLRLEPRAGDISKRMGLSPKENSLDKVPGAELFARAKKLEFLDATRLKTLGVSEENLSRFATTGFVTSVGKLCGLFFEESAYNPFSQYKRCERDPSGWLALVNTQHVHKIYSSAQAGPPEASSLSISAGLNFSDSESTSSGTSASSSTGWDMGTKGSVPGLGLVGIDIGIGVSMGQSWSTSTSWSRSNSKGVSRGFDEGKSISVDEIKFTVDADVDNCSVVSGIKPEPGAKKYLFCTPKPERKKFTEHYYHIFQSSRQGPIQDDGAGLNDRPLIALVRGTARYEQLKKVLQDPELSLNLSKSLPVPYELWKESEQRYDGFFPGLLTPR